MKRRHVIGILMGGALAALFIVWTVIVQPQANGQEYQLPEPAAVVHRYFLALDAQRAVEMYAALSDGFKAGEPTAVTLDAFRAYVAGQPVRGVEIISVEEVSNDGATATVAYDVVFTTADGSQQPFRGTFTLKKRDVDIIRGWKLIHAYGTFVDKS